MDEKKAVGLGTGNKKKEDEGLIYAGPGITELLLVFGKVYKELPKIPEKFKKLNLGQFFVKIEEYPKKKIELSKKAKEVLRQYREILREERKRR
jgi:hypothetical protein